MGDKKAIIEALCEQKYDKTNQDKIINILKDQAIAWEGVYKDDKISIPFILPFKFVDFFDIEFKRIDWVWCQLDNCKFYGCSFVGNKDYDRSRRNVFESSFFGGAHFYRCSFERIAFEGNMWRNCTFVDCSFNECEWQYSLMWGSNIINTDINNSVIQHSTFDTTELANSRLNNITTWTSVNQPVFINCRIHDNLMFAENNIYGGGHILVSRVNDNSKNVKSNAWVTDEYANQVIGKLSSLREIKAKIEDDNMRKIIENEIAEIVSSVSSIPKSCMFCKFIGGGKLLERKCFLFDESESEARYKCWDKKEQ